MEDVGEQEGEAEEFLDCVENNEEVISEGNEGGVHGISLYALYGSEGCQTMRVLGRIKNPLVLLVSSSSTHNFIDQAVAKKLRCQT